MHITINVHCETAAEAQAVVAWLGRMPSAELPVRVPLTRSNRGDIPPLPGPPREPGDDDDPVRPAPPPPKPKAPTGRHATPVYDGVPRTGRALNKWGCDHKALPAVNAAGKALSYPRLVSDWDEDQVARVFGQLGGAT